MDCDNHNGGCNGGGVKSAWNYINGVDGLGVNSDYPYTATCKTCSANKLKKHYVVFSDNVNWMINYVLKLNLYLPLLLAII